MAGTLRVKPGVYASSTHTHTSSDITDWTTALNTWLATKSTTNLAEGTNLYYTQARFDTAFGLKSTTNLAEGTNLYYTDARVISAITGGASSISNVNLTINRALISDASGKVAVSTVTNTELGYISGVTSAIQTQLNGKQASLGYTAENTANKGAVDGYASLDGTGKVPSSQLPSFVDDVLEYANLASFPATGSTGIIYVALDTNKIYRWSGSAYVEISGSPGSTDAVPEGSTNLYFTTARVLGTALTGLSLATGTAITSSDTILSAMGKLQKQITDLGTSKENAITAGTTSQYWRGDKSWQTLDKTAVGLGNVDNTSDATKNSATATLENKTLTKPTINGSVQGVTVDTDGATVTFDMSASNQHQVTLGGNRTFAVSNVSVGQYFAIDVIQDATGSRVPTWFSTIKWAGGTAPTLTTTG